MTAPDRGKLAKQFGDNSKKIVFIQTNGTFIGAHSSKKRAFQAHFQSINKRALSEKHLGFWGSLL